MLQRDKPGAAFLLGRGVRSDFRDAAGLTPLDYAALPPLKDSEPELLLRLSQNLENHAEFEADEARQRSSLIALLGD